MHIKTTPIFDSPNSSRLPRFLAFIPKGRGQIIRFGRNITCIWLSYDRFLVHWFGIPGASCRGCSGAATSQHTAPSPSSTAISGIPKVVHNWTKIIQDPVGVNSIVCN